MNDNNNVIGNCAKRSSVLSFVHFVNVGVEIASSFDKIYEELLNSPQ